MNGIDSRILIKILQNISPEINKDSLVYLLLANDGIIKRLMYGNNNTGKSSWPQHGNWLRHANEYTGFDINTYKATGINVLLLCCNPKETEIISLEQQFYDLFEEVFSIYFDTDINKIKSVILRVLRDEQVHANEIARVDKINEVSELIDFLIFRAKNKGEFPEISEQEDTFIIKKTEDPVVKDQNFSQINTSFRINADLPYVNDYVGDRKKNFKKLTSTLIRTHYYF